VLTIILRFLNLALNSMSLVNIKVPTYPHPIIPITNIDSSSYVI